MKGSFKFPNLKLLLVLVIVVVVMTKVKMGAHAQDLCLPQFALANAACRFLRLPSGGSSSPSPPPPSGNFPRMQEQRPFNDDDDDDESACCRRLKGVDNACVCGLLIRFPTFVTKPKHVITLSPEPGCDVSFDCDGI